MAGRADGLWRTGDGWVVEEVKSVVLDPSRFAEGEIARAVLEGAGLDQGEREIILTANAEALVNQLLSRQKV